MKTCRCGLTVPGFLRTCPQCSAKLIEDHKTTTGSWVAELTRNHGSMRGQVSAHLYEQVFGETFVPARAAARVREQVRVECELFFRTLAPHLGGKYTAEQLHDFLRRNIADSVSPDIAEQRGSELVRSLATLADLAGQRRREQEERIRQETERYEAEARRRREEQAFEHEKTELNRQIDDLRFDLDGSGYLTLSTPLLDQKARRLRSALSQAEQRLRATRSGSLDTLRDELWRLREQVDDYRFTDVPAAQEADEAAQREEENRRREEEEQRARAAAAAARPAVPAEVIAAAIRSMQQMGLSPEAIAAEVAAIVAGVHAAPPAGAERRTPEDL